MNNGDTLIPLPTSQQAAQSVPQPVHGGRRLAESSAARRSVRVSIVTVVFNGEEQLARTLNSVLAHACPELEHIVIDGGSTDGTVNVLRLHSDTIDYWISEPDSGIYDAMNKGIALARGNFVLHLNIGDELLSLPSVILGDIPSGVVCVAGRVQLSTGEIHAPTFDWRLRLHNTLHHQGCFYLRSPSLRYDTQYRVFADFDLNLRLRRTGRSVILCDDLVALHDVGGISHSAKNFPEVFRVIRTNHGAIWVALSYLFFKLRGLWLRLHRP